jgi:LytS/YehU family sensor histidine kinase
LKWRKYKVQKKVLLNLGLLLAIMLLSLMLHGPVWKLAFPADGDEYFLHSTFPTTFFFRDTLIRNLIICISSYYGAELYLSTRENFEMKTSLQILENEHVNSQLTTLMHQLNPHFLFNALNTLSGLVQESSEKSEEFIEKLSQVLRFSLTMQEHNIVTVADEINFARAYTYLLKVRFEEKIMIKFNIEPQQFNRLKVPSLCTQLLLENVIKHNLMSNKLPIHIEINYNNGFLSVCNNRNPHKNAESMGYGLNNLNRRCELLTKKAIIIEEKTATFCVKVPCIELI